MNGDAYRHLEAVLDREIEAAHTLATTLDAERVALTGSSPEEVVKVAAEKTRLVCLIEALENERRKLCAAARITLLGARAGGALDAATVAESVTHRWHGLLELIGRCRQSNDVNGYIINARRGQLNQLFAVLRGGAPLTYSPQGRTFAKSLRALAQA